MLDGSQNAKRQRDAPGDDGRQNRKLRRHLEAGQNLRQDVRTGAEGLPEIAVEHAADPSDILDDGGLVKAVAGVDLLDELRRGVDAKHAGGKAARNQAEYGENGNADAQQNGDELQQAPDDVVFHGYESTFLRKAPMGL